ncbi:MAG TPA: HEAT repeat domain-containing protein [Pyrinomonadaceae bacterium]|jgi:hypothetical protein|nr:HEAT repeat domain-containing protein [Pyrinomonadaceae bacterium]
MFLMVSLLLSLCALSPLASARAQQMQAFAEAPEAAPPPMKYIPPQERALLDVHVRDAKARTRVSLDLAEARLLRAAQLTDAAQFDAASSELGIYQAIVEDAVSFLRRQANADNKTRDLCKRLEVSLRAHGPRIETIRRMTPSEDAPNVRAAYECTRRARSEALNAFYGQTVMDEPAVAEASNAHAPATSQVAPPAVDSHARLRAAYDLLSVKAKAKEALPELIALLKDAEALVRGNAAYGLGCIGPDAQTAVPALLELLKDKNSLVRYSAAEAIAKIGLAAVPALDKATKIDK